MSSPKMLLRASPWKIARLLARKLGAIAALVFLGGLLSATLVRMAPGFDADERELDPSLNSESVRALRQSRAGEHNILSFYSVYLRGAIHGDLRQGARERALSDFGRGKLIKEIAGVQEPRAVLYRSDLSKLYVSDGGGALRIFDSNTFAPPGAGVLRSPGPLNHGECQ